MDDCLFCKIVAGKIPSKKIYETENVLIFEDIAPMAPRHYLCIHKKHDTDITEMVQQNPKHLRQVFQAIQHVTQQAEFQEGYRVVTNKGADAGQTVFHTHFHLLAGGKLRSFGA